jgi:hypothetical protein
MPICAPGHAGNVEGRHAAAAAVLHLDLDLLVVELARAAASAELLARLGLAPWADQGVEHPLLGGSSALA